MIASRACRSRRSPERQWNRVRSCRDLPGQIRQQHDCGWNSYCGQTSTSPVQARPVHPVEHHLAEHRRGHESPSVNRPRPSSSGPVRQLFLCTEAGGVVFLSPGRQSGLVRCLQTRRAVPPPAMRRLRDTIDPAPPRTPSSMVFHLLPPSSQVDAEVVSRGVPAAFALAEHLRSRSPCSTTKSPDRGRT